MLPETNAGEQNARGKNIGEKIGAYLSGAMEEPKCPVCQSKQIRRSRPRLRDIPFVLFRAKPNRCMACYRRFYTWPWSRSA